MHQPWSVISGNQKTSTPVCRQWEAFQLKMDFKSIMSLFLNVKCIFQRIRAIKFIYVLRFFKDSNAIREWSVLIVEWINFCSLELNIFSVTKEVLESFSKGQRMLIICPKTGPFFLAQFGYKTQVQGLWCGDLHLTQKQPRKYWGRAVHGGTGWLLLKKAQWRGSSA